MARIWKGQFAWVCRGLGWDRVNFLPESWHGAVLTHHEQAGGTPGAGRGHSLDRGPQLTPG